CTKCGAHIWVHEDIAQLTRIRALAGGEMEQTGGMCSALVYYREDRTVVVTNMDYDLAVAVFQPKAWEEGEDTIRAYSLPLTTPTHAAAAVIRTALAEPLKH